MLFAPLFLGVAAVASAISGVGATIDGHGSGRAPSRVLKQLTPQQIAALNTNSKRLAAGLPPLPVRRKWTRTDNARRADPSAQAQTESVQTRRADTNQPVGYLSQPSASGYSLDTTSTNTNANRVKYTAATTGTTSQINIADLSQPGTSTTPVIGAVIAPGTTLADGSSNVAWLVPTANYGTTPTTPQSTTGGDAESAIWNVNADTGALTPAWVNYNSATNAPYQAHLYFFPAAADNSYPARLGISSPAVLTDPAYNPAPYEVTLYLTPSQ